MIDAVPCSRVAELQCRRVGDWIALKLYSFSVLLRMSESTTAGVQGNSKELRSLALTPTWSLASVLTIFVVVSLLVERSIHRLGNVSVLTCSKFRNFGQYILRMTNVMY